MEVISTLLYPSRRSSIHPFLFSVSSWEASTCTNVLKQGVIATKQKDRLIRDNGNAYKIVAHVNLPLQGKYQ